MDKLDIQIMSDIRDLREDYEAGLFKDNPIEWNKRWAMIAKKVEQQSHEKFVDEIIPVNNLD